MFTKMGFVPFKKYKILKNKNNFILFYKKNPQNASEEISTLSLSLLRTGRKAFEQVIPTDLIPTYFRLVFAFPSPHNISISVSPFLLHYSLSPLFDFSSFFLYCQNFDIFS